MQSLPLHPPPPRHAHTPFSNYIFPFLSSLSLSSSFVYLSSSRGLGTHRPCLILTSNRACILPGRTELTATTPKEEQDSSGWCLLSNLAVRQPTTYSLQLSRWLPQTPNSCFSYVSSKVKGCEHLDPPPSDQKRKTASYTKTILRSVFPGSGVLLPMCTFLAI